ncbi:MAG: hypothetical protein TREMPRED_005102, partial [Tremellales sp. Tagirdzhanova-0007]
MSSAVPTPSLEPYLRARAVNPSLIPSRPPRTARHHVQTTTTSDDPDFLDFLRGLLQLAFAPVIVPLRVIHQTLTSALSFNLALKLAMLGLLTIFSAVFSVMAVGVFWYAWGRGSPVQVEGWLQYGSRAYRTPYSLIPLPVDRFLEDVKYDVHVEMELVRPARGAEEMGNFMLSLELRSNRNADLVIFSAAQPSLPPPSLPASVLSATFSPTMILPPIFASPAQGNVVPLSKELIQGITPKPTLGGETAGSVFVSIGREDSFSDAVDGGPQCNVQPRELAPALTPAPAAPPSSA